MPTTKETAYGEMCGIVKNTIATSELPSMLITWPNVAGDAPAARQPDTQSPAPWARVTIREIDNRQRGVGSLPGGLRRFEVTGMLSVELYLPGGAGLGQSSRIATTLLDQFRGKRTASGVFFPSPTSREIGNDGPFYRTDVMINFRYDELK